MRHDPIDPARCPDPESPAVGTPECWLATFGPRLDALEQRALAMALSPDVATYEYESLEEIAAARARLRNGTFGTCEACGSMIPLSRLEAIPTASQCLPCQTKAEHAGRQGRAGTAG